MTMREILFRGKSKATGDWRMGWYQPDFEYKWELTEKDARHSDAAICFLNYNTRPDWSYVDANTVGQYTGLIDKNGTKIFEGDVVHMRTSGLSGHGEIVYKDGSFGIEDKKRNRFYYMYHDAIYRVEGNIHDNPELMEGE